MKKVLKALKTLIPLLIILYFGAYFFVSVFFPDKKITVFGYSLSIVQTGSMEPKIKVRDGIFIVRVRKDNLKEGDIINFRARVKNKAGEIEEINVVHYLGYVGEDGAYYKTQSQSRKEEGSFDLWYDEEGMRTERINPEDILGKVAFRIPRLGYFVETFRDPMMLLLLALDGLLIILLAVILKEPKKNAEGAAAKN